MPKKLNHKSYFILAVLKKLFFVATKYLELLSYTFNNYINGYKKQ